MSEVEDPDKVPVPVPVHGVGDVALYRVQYRYGGKIYLLDIEADGMDDARRRVHAIGMNGIVTGVRHADGGALRRIAGIIRGVTGGKIGNGI